MSITSTCPGCGASLSIEEDAREVTCQFCGTHFQVNMDGVAPAFHKAAQPAEPRLSDFQEPVTQGILPLASEPALSAGDEFYNPPIPGDLPTSTEELYNPPIPGVDATTGSSPAQVITPPAFENLPASPLSRFAGSRIWIAIAIAAFAIFCGSCLCMVLFAFRINQ